MYCEKCGTKLDEKTKKCKNCEEPLHEQKETEKEEEKLDTKKGTLILPIFAVALSFIWPVGLTLAIIGTIKYNKLRKEEKYNNPNITLLNVIAFVISGISFLMTVVALFIFVFIASVVTTKDKDVFGDYTCYISRYSQMPVVSASFKNKKFSWAKYGDEEDNVLMGTYFTNKREIKNGTQTYGLILKPNYYEADNKLKIKNRYNITITTNGTDKANISFENGSTYYCDKIGD